MIESYVKITKEKEDANYQLLILGDDDIAVEMLAHILIHDERGRNAFLVAEEYCRRYGTTHIN